jgi:hypothetical protein
MPHAGAWNRSDQAYKRNSPAKDSKHNDITVDLTWTNDKRRYIAIKQRTHAQNKNG